MMREALFQRKTISHFKFDLHDAVQRQVADKPGIPAARQACSIPQPEGEKKKKRKKQREAWARGAYRFEEARPAGQGDKCWPRHW